MAALARFFVLSFWLPLPSRQHFIIMLLSLLFTARCYASAVLAMGLCLCLSGSLSVCHKSEFY